MNTALILIDVQESFRQRPYWAGAETRDLVARVNSRVDGGAARGVPIGRLLHSDGPAEATNPFALESGHVRPRAEQAVVVRRDMPLDLRYRLIGIHMPLHLEAPAAFAYAAAGVKSPAEFQPAEADALTLATLK